MKEKLKKLVKNINAAKITAIIFLIFIIYVGCAVFPSFVTNTGESMENEETLAEYIEKIDSRYADMLSTSLDYKFLQNKGPYINLNGMMANSMRQKKVNDVVKLDNGHLTSYGTEKQEIDSAYNAMKKIYDRQLDHDGMLLVVLTPSQISKYEDFSPAGYNKDFSNENLDSFSEKLVKNGIPVLDLREKMNEQQISYDEAFYKTDHHWTAEMGFWAYAEILKKLSEMGEIRDVDSFYIDADNYEFKLYEDSFLGSSGKRTGKYFAGTDDFRVIVPKFDHNISVSIPTQDFEQTGRYENVSYRYDMEAMDKMLKKNDYYNINPYGLYGHGDTDLTHWRNPQAPEEASFMLIGDSFGNVPFSLMSLYAQKCDELDMRHFQGAFADVYAEAHPDIVIVTVTPTGILSKNVVAFNDIDF